MKNQTLNSQHLQNFDKFRLFVSLVYNKFAKKLCLLFFKAFCYSLDDDKRGLFNDCRRAEQSQWQTLIAAQNNNFFVHAPLLLEEDQSSTMSRNIMGIIFLVEWSQHNGISCLVFICYQCVQYAVYTLFTIPLFLLSLDVVVFSILIH